MRPAIAVALCLPLVLTGCTLSPTAAPAPDAGLAIEGVVHGGQQPIVGAHVYLFAAGTASYAGPGIAASGLNASVPLLSAAATGHSDSLGAYVLTGATGAFSISGDYSCVPNTQVYLYALGGNPGLSGNVNNSAAGLMAVLGNCPSSGNFLTATPYVVVNEVSTVAAAYAFAGFASDAIHVSTSGTALGKIGIQNAFANTANLAGLSTGLALATTPNGNGTPPQSEINTLADILASCVNTDGTISGPTSPTPCYTLFNNALSGGTTGTVPSDTATAAINIAHNPGANVAALYALPTAQAPFGPVLASAPNDFTVGVQFTGGGLSDPVNNAIAIDGSGDVWVSNNSTPSSISELSSTGVPISPSSGYTGGGLNGAESIAIDLSGNAWIANYNGNSVTELTSTGSAVSGSPFTGTGLAGAYGIAIDGSGYVWVSTIKAPNSVTRLNSSGVVQTGFPFTTGLSNTSPRYLAIDGSGNAWVASKSSLVELSVAGVQVGLSPYTGNGLNIPYSIAIDNAGDAWLANEGGLTTSVSEFANTGAAVSGSPFTNGGVNTPEAIAIDGAGNAWVGNNGANTISEISNAGVALTPSTGYMPPGIDSCIAIAVDGSGDVWVADSSKIQITEVIGAATPVVTPLSVGVANHSLGTRP